MTEEEWLGCADPDRMLELIGARASDIEVRLFVCACARRVWHLLTAMEQKNLEASEAYAHGRITLADLKEAWRWPAARPLVATVHNAGSPARDYALRASRVGKEGRPVKKSNRAIREAERVAQADLLRCLFAPPGGPETADPAWLNWGDGTVGKMVQTIHDEGAFDHLPILADALEEAGCTDPRFLGHCRHPSQHVRGCWVVALLLKQSRLTAGGRTGARRRPS
jgi:hypothetical protein